MSAYGRRFVKASIRLLTRHSSSMLCIATVLSLFVWAAHAQDIALVEAERAIRNALPSGWSIVERKLGEIPWGHHWCDKYVGVTGTELIIRGINLSMSRFLGRDDQWRDVVVGAEALDVWIMPGSYRESRSDWFCFQRPPQPNLVTELRDIRIYARPTHHASSDEKRIFDKQLADSKAVESPESPWNDPARLSWRSWQADINAAVAKKSSH